MGGLSGSEEFAVPFFEVGFGIWDSRAGLGWWGEAVVDGVIFVRRVWGLWEVGGFVLGMMLSGVEIEYY